MPLPKQQAATLLHIGCQGGPLEVHGPCDAALFAQHACPPGLVLQCLLPHSGALGEMSKWAFPPHRSDRSDLQNREGRFPELSWNFRGNFPKSEHFA